MKRKIKVISLSLWLSIILFYTGVLGYIVYRHDFYQWDFKTFYYAAKAHSLNLNPYGVTNLSKLAKTTIRFRFRYPPFTIWFFRLFSWLNYKGAYYAYLGLKCLLLGLLYFIWAKIILRPEVDLWFYPFSFLAFNSAIFVDLMSGNVTIIEQFWLWLGFVCLIKRRLLLFCLFVIIAASFKVTPAFFLFLLLFDDHIKKYMYLIGSLLTFGLAHLISFLTDPLYQDFIIFNRILEKGWANPSSLSLIESLAKAISGLFNYALPSLTHFIIYVIFVGFAVFLSGKGCASLKSLSPLSDMEKRRRLIIFFCLIYAVIVPRFIAYSQMILIIPAYHIMKRFLGGKEAFWLMLILLSLQTPERISPPFLGEVFNFVWTYLAILAALALWLLYLTKLKSQRTD